MGDTRSYNMGFLCHLVGKKIIEVVENHNFYFLRENLTFV